MSKKSKKYRNQKPQTRIPWLIAGLGGLLLLVAVFLFSQQDRGTPVISVDQDVIDFGDVRLDTPLTFAITVTNRGDGALRFKEAPYLEVKEGC
jgi:hypothetical protein